MRPVSLVVRSALALSLTLAVTPSRASSTHDVSTSARIRYETGRTLLVSGAALGGLGTLLLALEPFADGTPFVGVGVGAVAIGAVAGGIGLPLWLSSRAYVEVGPHPLARGLAVTGRF